MSTCAARLHAPSIGRPSLPVVSVPWRGLRDRQNAECRGVVRQGAGCNCDPSAVEEGWRGVLAARRRQAPRGFVREQKGPYAVLSIAGFLLGALVAAGIAGLVLAVRRRRRAAASWRPSARPHQGTESLLQLLRLLDASGSASSPGVQSSVPVRRGDAARAQARRRRRRCWRRGRGRVPAQRGLFAQQRQLVRPVLPLACLLVLMHPISSARVVGFLFVKPLASLPQCRGIGCLQVRLHMEACARSVVQGASRLVTCMDEQSLPCSDSA